MTYLEILASVHILHHEQLSLLVQGDYRNRQIVFKFSSEHSHSLMLLTYASLTLEEQTEISGNSYWVLQGSEIFIIPTSPQLGLLHSKLVYP